MYKRLSRRDVEGEGARPCGVTEMHRRRAIAEVGPQVYCTAFPIFSACSYDARSGLLATCDPFCSIWPSAKAFDLQKALCLVGHFSHCTYLTAVHLTKCDLPLSSAEGQESSQALLKLRNPWLTVGESWMYRRVSSCPTLASHRVL